MQEAYFSPHSVCLGEWEERDWENEDRKNTMGCTGLVYVYARDSCSQKEAEYNPRGEHKLEGSLTPSGSSNIIPI